jgi:SAF domain
MPGAAARKQGTLTSPYVAPASPQAPGPDGRATGITALHGGPARLAPRRRRRWSRLAAGIVTVLICLFGFLAATSAVLGGHTTQVLAVSRAVPAGTALSAADLTVVAMRPAPGVATLPASEQAQLAGRTTAVPLTAGTLLTAADLGPPRYPPAGEAIVALPLTAGAFPPQMQIGARVAVMDGHAASSGSGQQAAGPASVMTGVVTAITPGGGAGGTQAVISLLVDTAAAPAVEQLASPVLVILDPAGTDVP